MIYGKLGAGKSSFLYSLLGELSAKLSPDSRFEINGSLSYIGQKAWLFSDTIKENITLG
jgi:ABC-type transport system involved in cytochrome bd biosynthesis fused ATPase/permease subunit